MRAPDRDRGSWRAPGRDPDGDPRAGRLDDPRASPRRVPTLLVGVLCAVLAGVLIVTRGFDPFPPDTAHAAVLARNLVRGNGFTINFIQYHVGVFGELEHVPEMHGILQPILLAGLFAVFGEQPSLVRVPGMVYVALTGWLAFLYARRLFGDAAALAACALTLSSGLLWFWGWLGVDDSGFACWFLLAVMALDIALERRTALWFLLAGSAAAGALLQKLTGSILLLVAFAAFACERNAPARSRLRWLALWLAPWGAALALYLVRNLFASGGLMFRFGPIDWVYKARGFEAFFAVYDAPPSLFGVLASIGAAEVAGIVARALAAFARAALAPTPWLGGSPFTNLTEPPWLAPVGFASLVVVARAAPRFARLGLLSVLASVAFVCGIFHFEARYFTQLVPLLAVATGGALVVTARAAKARWGRAGSAGIATFGIAILALDAGFLARASMQPTPPSAAPACASSLEWIRSETAPGDRILTFDPWTISWATGRPAIVVPSGPREDVERVIARYRPRWLLIQPMPGRARSLENLRAMVATPTPRFAARPVHADAGCAVYRIRSARGRTAP